MNYKSLLIIMVLGLNSLVQAQENENLNKASINAYENSGDSTVYEGMSRLIANSKEISYLGIRPAIRPVSGTRRFGLEPGEGQAGYLLSGQIHQYFTIGKGRPMSTAFWQKLALNFYFGYDLRMTLDESKPLLPSNQRIGLEGSYIFWDSYSQKEEVRGYDPRNWKDSKDYFQFVYGTFRAYHYSNGQAPGFYKDTTTFQHDYISGDFSTNVLRWDLNYQYLAPSHRSVFISSGYQYDFGTEDGALKYSPEQENSYGRHRFNLVLQYLSKPKNFSGLAKIYTDYETKERYVAKRMAQWKFRSELQLITGDLDEFQAKIEGQKYRFSVHNYIEYCPLWWRSLGFTFHHYYGRDYFNIRYDDIVNYYSFGITFNLNKVFPPRFKSSESIISTLK